MRERDVGEYKSYQNMRVGGIEARNQQVESITFTSAQLLLGKVWIHLFLSLPHKYGLNSVSDCAL